MNLKRLLGAENGLGAAIGTLLLLGSGLTILFISVAGLSEVSRLKPEERGCAAWLADPSGPRWVKLMGCQLNVSQATPRDGGVLIPFFAEAAPEGVRGVLATSDLALLDGGVSGYVMKDSEGVVLEYGKQPPRLRTLFGLVVGLIAVALVVRSMFIRYLVDRE